MQKATLGQIKKLLDLLTDVPYEQVQHLLGSGLFSDLLDADIDRINRLQFRKACLLDPSFHCTPTFGSELDYRKEGWLLEKDTDNTLDGVFTPKFVKLKMRTANLVECRNYLRRNKLNPLGHRHLEAILREACSLPRSLRRYRLVFLDTVWSYPNNPKDKRIVELYWYESKENGPIVGISVFYLPKNAIVLTHSIDLPVFLECLKRYELILALQGETCDAFFINANFESHFQ